MKKIIVIAAVLAGISSIGQAHELSTKHAAWQACEANELRDPCSYTLSHARYTGSCQSFNEQLMCVRQKPIELIDQQEEVEHEH